MPGSGTVPGRGRDAWRGWSPHWLPPLPVSRPLTSHLLPVFPSDRPPLVKIFSLVPTYPWVKDARVQVSWASTNNAISHQHPVIQLPVKRTELSEDFSKQIRSSVLQLLSLSECCGNRSNCLCSLAVLWRSGFKEGMEL